MPDSREAEELRALERLEDERTLFEPAATRVVQAVLERAKLDGRESPVVEIGSGGGQLRRWLPAPLLPAMVHTEREPAFVRRFRQRWEWPRYRATASAEGSLMSVEGVVLRDTLQGLQK
jgi:hypothetical protein